MIKYQLGGKTINWKLKKIGVVGPGIVGMPMAALLADAKIKIGVKEPAKVVVVQRNSATSGWKVDAINNGKTVIGGIEPGLNTIVSESVNAGLLSATHDFNDLSDADMILVSVQTDKKGFEPDYGPMFGALTSLAKALVNKPKEKVPLIVFESTLAPSSMMTLMKDFFAKFGLYEGKDILLGNSPNRVMPGRLVERVQDSDKLIGGLNPVTADLIKAVYAHIVTRGILYTTNSLSAEIEKTLENAYRDVRIAFSTEIVRYCDDQNIDYYQVRENVNSLLAQTDKASTEPNTVPAGGLLIPTIGVGGHCLPKDGILLWWRKIESGIDTSGSLILKSRNINDASPSESIKRAESIFGKMDGSRVALLGAAYRFNSEDTRNSPTLELAKQLVSKGCHIKIHDPFVKPDDQNLMACNFQEAFTNHLHDALEHADYIMICTAHQFYIDQLDLISSGKYPIKGLFDGCNIYQPESSSGLPFVYGGIGRGKNPPDDSFINFVHAGFIAVERGVGNELKSLITFLNNYYADTAFNKAEFSEVQKLASTCSTGCQIADADQEIIVPVYQGFSSELVKLAKTSGVN